MGNYPVIACQIHRGGCHGERTGDTTGYRVVCGEFYPKAVNDTHAFPPSLYRVIGILDVDGDSAEELLVQGHITTANPSSPRG